MNDKYIVFISHCFFNPHSKVINYGKNPIEGEPIIRGKILSLFFEHNIGAIQLPCPEMVCYGLKRWGHVKDQFEHVHYRKVSRELLMPYIDELKEYINNGYQLFGVIGIERSPSCGVAKTYRGDWKGEIGGNPLFKDNQVEGIYLADEKGLFMEILEEMLLEIGIKTAFYGYSPKEGEEFQKLIEDKIKAVAKNG